MKLTLTLVCFILAALCFLLAGLGVGIILSREPARALSLRDFGYFFVMLGIILTGQ